MAASADPAPWRGIIKHLVVGLAKTAVGYGVYAALVIAGLHHQVALAVSYVTVGAASYRWHAQWVFGSRGSWRGLMAYLMINAGIYGLNAGLLGMATHAGVHPLVAQLLAMLVTVPAGYWTLRRWIAPLPG